MVVMRFWSTSVAALALLNVVACSAVATTDGNDSAAADTSSSAPALSTIKGREWARCWFDVSGDNAQLSCKSTARGNDPLAATVEVVGTPTGPGPDQFKPFQHGLDIEQGGTIVLGTISRSSFPVILDITTTLAGSAQNAIGLTNNVDFELQLTVQSPDDLSADKAGIMAQPFDLWPVETIDAMTGFGGGFGVQATEYTHDLGPYKDFINTPAMKLAPSVMADRKVHYFVAPASGPIAIDEQLNGNHVATSITGPGYYALTPQGLRAATAAEIGGQTNGGGGGNVTPTPAPTPDPTPAPTPSPTPAPTTDPDPTCGGDGQSICQNLDKKCDDGNRYSQGANSCVACGGDGQTYCYQDPNNYDGSSGSKCNAGTRFSQGQNACVACGADGQTYCFQDSNNYDGSSGSKCNDGTRYSQGQNACIACGASGQTACFQDPNNYDGSSGEKCNDGSQPTFSGDCN